MRLSWYGNASLLEKADEAEAMKKNIDHCRALLQKLNSQLASIVRQTETLKSRCALRGQTEAKYRDVCQELRLSQECLTTMKQNEPSLK